jgi:hypothetical protein
VNSLSPLMPDELVYCVASGFEATATQVSQLAARIWAEAAPHRSAFAWSDLAPAASDRLFAMRSAAMALNGC